MSTEAPPTIANNCVRFVDVGKSGRGRAKALESAVPLLIREMEQCFAGKDVAIAFPDDGAEKRFSKIFPKEYNRIVCNKQRDGEKRVVRIKEGDPAGKEVVLVDDLVQTGGTLLEAAKVVRAAGAASVSAYATHAVFPKESWRKFVDGEDKILANFWITDSIPHAVDISKHPPFKLLGLAPIIANVLLGFDLKMSE